MKDVSSIEYLDIPEGVTVQVKARKVTVEGPRGTLTKNAGHIQMDIQVVSGEFSSGGNGWVSVGLVGLWVVSDGVDRGRREWARRLDRRNRKSQQEYSLRQSGKIREEIAVMLDGRMRWSYRPLPALMPAQPRPRTIPPSTAPPVTPADPTLRSRSQSPTRSSSLSGTETESTLPVSEPSSRWSRTWSSVSQR